MMNIIRNEVKIKRNKKISQAILYLSLAILLIGFLWSITDPDSIQLSISYALIGVAYILVQISLYMANRWGRSPRPDQIVEQSLKGLNDQYTLYTYSTPVPHLLIGPAGIWILKPYHHSGVISYNSAKQRFEQRGGPNIFSKLFAQESLPNIIDDSKIQINRLNKYFRDFGIREPEKIQVANIFFSDNAEIKAKNAPEVTVPANRLKDVIRSHAKLLNLKDELLAPIREKLPQK